MIGKAEKYRERNFVRLGSMVRMVLLKISYKLNTLLRRERNERLTQNSRLFESDNCRTIDALKVTP